MEVYIKSYIAASVLAVILFVHVCWLFVLSYHLFWLWSCVHTCVGCDPMRPRVLAVILCVNVFWLWSCFTTSVGCGPFVHVCCL